MNNSRIGILTFHWSDNYGAVLQAYALQTFVRKHGFDCEIINYLPPSRSLIERIVSKSPKRQFEKICLFKKHLAFQKFRRKYLVLSEKTFRSADSLGSAALSLYSDIIVGSDQVWNPTFHTAVKDFYDVYMLSFVGKLNKISYASSVGHTSKDTISLDAQHRFREYIPHFNHISVREESSICLLKSLGVNNQICHVCDPTILLDVNHFHIGYSRSSHSSYVFSYILHDADDEFIPINKLLTALLKCNVITCNSQTLMSKSYVLPSPIDWLFLLREASFISTNSFHGVVFAIKYHVPFIAVSRSDTHKAMNTRLISLLSMLGLSERLVVSSESLNKDLIETSINWKEVEDRLGEFRNSSASFLLNALQSK